MLRRDLLTPDEAYARHYCLHKGVEAPDLVTGKDSFRFYITPSYDRIVAIPTVDSINSITEWFLGNFTLVTGTATNEKPGAKCTT